MVGKSDWRSASRPVQVLRDLDAGALAVERDLEIARIDLEVRGENQGLVQSRINVAKSTAQPVCFGRSGKSFGRKTETAE